MSISSHAICDHCERKLIPVEDGSLSEESVADSGWIVVKWSEGDEEERTDEARDFCSFLCASRWCANESQETASKESDARTD